MIEHYVHFPGTAGIGIIKVTLISNILTSNQQRRYKWLYEHTREKQIYAIRESNVSLVDKQKRKSGCLVYKHKL